MINRILHSCSCNSECIKLVGEIDRMLGTASHLNFFPTRIINSIIHKHTCKILYLKTYEQNRLELRFNLCTVTILVILSTDRSGAVVLMLFDFVIAGH